MDNISLLYLEPFLKLSFSTSMQKRHKDRSQYFKEQGITTKKYVIPYIEDVRPITKDSRILEIGCGEGGNLTPFVKLGCEVVGVDLNEGQLNRAKQFLKDAVPNANPKLLYRNIYDVSPDDIGKFDVIMLRDVIEHIPNQLKFMGHLKSFLGPNSVVFFGFPPWRMPFGGHQQICRSKFLSKLPYFHLLPIPLYKAVLKMFDEPKGVIDSLIEIKETGISINRFHSIVAKNNFEFAKKTHFLINPNYEIKFGLKPRKQYSIIKSIPYFRDFLTTCLYCVIKVNEVD